MRTCMHLTNPNPTVLIPTIRCNKFRLLFLPRRQGTSFLLRIQECYETYFQNSTFYLRAHSHNHISHAQCRRMQKNKRTTLFEGTLSFNERQYCDCSNILNTRISDQKQVPMKGSRSPYFISQNKTYLGCQGN